MLCSGLSFQFCKKVWEWELKVNHDRVVSTGPGQCRERLLAERKPCSQIFTDFQLRLGIEREGKGLRSMLAHFPPRQDKEALGDFRKHYCLNSVWKNQVPLFGFESFGSLGFKPLGVSTVLLGLRNAGLLGYIPDC